MSGSVDVIMPVYNEKYEYLKEAIDSCLKQTYKPSNIIVVDDCSAKDYSFVTRFDDRVKYIRTDSNLGPGGARNVGIFSKYCTSDYVSFLDSDDIMDTQKLAHSVRELDSSKAGMTCGNYRIIVNRSKLLNPFYKRSIKINWDALMRQNFVASGSVTVRKDALIDVGGFEDRFMIGEDYATWLKIAEKYDIKYIHKVLYYYSVCPNNGSLTQRSDIQVKHMSNLKLIKKESMERMNG